MKALCYHGPEDIRLDTIADPIIQDDRDVIVRTLACGICGSDLHIYHGHAGSGETGFCVGHEAVGEVVEVGRAVRALKTGDRVMMSASVGCGQCPSCLAGNIVRCTSGHRSAPVYGGGHDLQGCQAEAVRVPAAESNVARLPEGVSVEQALMLTDNLPTAWFGCRNADIRPGSTVAVVGLGPIGLMAVEAAFVLGASRVFAIDLVAQRRELAAGLGAVSFGPETAVEAIRDATHGRMAESVVEAVGADATIQLALRLAGVQGVVSVVGVNQSQRMDFPLTAAFWRNLTFRIGLCPVQGLWPELIPLVQQGRLRPERFITSRLPLAEGPQAYRIFAERRAGALKTVLTP